MDNARKTSYGLKSHVACTYSYYLGIGSQTLCGTFPHSCRENFSCLFPLLEDGGGRADSGCWRAPCCLHVYMDSAAQLRPPVYIHPGCKMDSFSFLCVKIFWWYYNLFARPVNKCTAIKNFRQNHILTKPHLWTKLHIHSSPHLWTKSHLLNKPYLGINIFKADHIFWPNQIIEPNYKNIPAEPKRLPKLRQKT